MQIIRDKDTLRQAVEELRAARGPVALVPTMGALHAGHMDLVAAARRQSEVVVASIFVNPTQFAPNEDLSRYPRREQEDARLLEQEGCDILWMPSAQTMYPTDFSTSIRVSGVSEGLCGASRPGHFEGVATVVAKLFNQVRPDLALFGEKDFQQLAVIRRMVQDLDFPIRIIGIATRRDPDGLALSSRNLYLSPAEREAALALPRALAEAGAAIRSGTAVGQALMRARQRLEAAGFSPIDYVELRDADTLEVMTSHDRPARLLAAARIGTTRLIDNIAV